MLPLDFKLLQTLKKGSARLGDDARLQAISYVKGQMLEDGSFRNRGGRSDLYYTMFGWMMCYAFNIHTDNGQRKSYLQSIDRDSLDSLHSTVYEQCLLLDDLLRHGLWQAAAMNWRKRHHLEAFMQQFAGHTVTQTLSGTAAQLFADHIDKKEKEKKIQYIISLQDPTGGFRANEGAALPDLLSTAVALFTLKAEGARTLPTGSSNMTTSSPLTFIEAHFQDDGSFMPNLIDEQSDVEYSFYGLLALGSVTTDN